MATMDELPRQPRGESLGGSMSQNQGNQGSQGNQGGGVNWGYVVIALIVLWVIFGQGNLAANTWAVAQNTGATQAQGDIVTGLAVTMKGFGSILNNVQTSMATLSQNQAYLGQRMDTLETTVNQQGTMIGNINANVLSLQQGQQTTNALLLSLENGSQPQNASIMGQMFDGQVGTQVGSMQLAPSNGVAGVFPGSQLMTTPNGEMHVTDPFGRIGVTNGEPNATLVTPGGQP